MADFLKMDKNGNFHKVVEDTKNLGDGSEVAANYDARSFIDKKVEVIKKIAEEMVANCFDIDAYIKKQDEEYRSWVLEREKKIGQKASDKESHIFGGLCPTCMHRMAGFDFITTLYHVCYKCKTHGVIEEGYLCEDSDEEQAYRLLVLENTDEVDHKELITER